MIVRVRDVGPGEAFHFAQLKSKVGDLVHPEDAALQARVYDLLVNEEPLLPSRCRHERI